MIKKRGLVGVNKWSRQNDLADLNVTGPDLSNKRGLRGVVGMFFSLSSEDRIRSRRDLVKTRSKTAFELLSAFLFLPTMRSYRGLNPSMKSL